ncbi:SEC14-like protein 2, partial [Grifola frondosa]
IKCDDDSAALAECARSVRSVLGFFQPSSAAALTMSDSPDIVDPDVLTGHLGHLSPQQQSAFAAFKDILANAHLYTPQTTQTSLLPPTTSPPYYVFFAHVASTTVKPTSSSPMHTHGAHAITSTLSTPLFLQPSSSPHAASTPAGPGAATRYRWFSTAAESTNMYVPYPVPVERTASVLSRRSSTPYPPNVATSVCKSPQSTAHPSRRSLIPAQRRAVRNHDLLRPPPLHPPPPPHSPHPISSVTTIIDLDSVSLTSLWSLRAHLQEASTLATANYPETLSTIAVVNSPAFFPTVWGWVKPWFDEGTRRKVHVLGKDPGPVLRTLIDPKDLPKPYGGDLNWTFEDEPALDDAARELLGEMPKGPVVFEDGRVRHPIVPHPMHHDSAAGSSHEY